MDQIRCERGWWAGDAGAATDACTRSGGCRRTMRVPLLCMDRIRMRTSLAGGDAGAAAGTCNQWRMRSTLKRDVPKTSQLYYKSNILTRARTQSCY
jgi:hypothetical protein